LDQRLVPRLGGALRRIGGAGRRTTESTGAPGQVVGRLVRREPVITAAVVVVAAAAVLLAATGGDLHRAVKPTSTVASSPPLPNDVLGPTAGQPVAGYLATAQSRLKAMTAGGSAGQVTAVVDLSGYLTAAALGAQLDGLTGVQLIRAFARVAPPADGDIHTITVIANRDLAVDLDEVQAEARTVVANYRKRVAIAAADPSAANKAVVSAYAGEARQAKVDASGIGAGAGCVFAMVVTAAPDQLERLATSPDVRVLDPAPSSVPQQALMIVPLEPQTIGTVPPLEFAGD
jgi:hypothetical protein